MSNKEVSTATARRSAVAKAWAHERALIQEGKATRNWAKSQQAEIMATGKCKGFFGHHKFSVKNNPSEAGNVDNIQFLTQKEHQKAHDNNFKNDPRGRYDPKTQKLIKYKDGHVDPEPVIDLKERMAESRMKSSQKKYEQLQAEKHATAREYQHRKANKVSLNNSQSKRTAQSKASNGIRNSSRTLSAKKTSSIRSEGSSKALSTGRAAGRSGSRSLSGSKALAAGRSSGGVKGHASGQGGKGAGSAGGKGLGSAGGKGAGSAGGTGLGNAGGKGAGGSHGSRGK